jgi:hypothetical protein
MKTKLNYFYAVLLIMSFTAALAFDGCGKQDQKTDDKKTDSTKTTDQKNSNQTAGENKTSTDPKSNELGIKEGMPADYPTDIPQPSNAKCLGSLNTSEGTVVTFESTDKPKVLLVPFAEGVEKSGFKKSEGEMMSDDGGMTMWTKDKREVNIMLAWDKEKSVTSVVVTYK